eukprot:5003443-Pyramimonas_sp.AAC.1
MQLRGGISSAGAASGAREREASERVRSAWLVGVAHYSHPAQAISHRHGLVSVHGLRQVV